jgi:hypothetical protein
MQKRTHAERLPQELQEKFHLLKLRSPAGERVESHIDASELLDQITLSIQRNEPGLTAQHAKQIRLAIERWYAKRSRGSVRFSESSIAALGSILSLASQLYFKRLSSVSAKKRGRDRAGQASFFAEGCLNTLISACKVAEEPSSWAHTLSYIRSLRGTSSAMDRDFWQRPILAERFELVRKEMRRALEWAVEKGRTEEANETLSCIAGDSAFRQEAEETLRNLLKDKGARLPFVSQEWIAAQVGAGPGQRHVEYANPAESPEIRQAAGLLLFLWDHAKEPGMMREALERFRALCEKHFFLFLKGQIDSVMSYDARVHEAPSAAPVRGPVKILRPWVEWFRPPKASIVIRALVTPVET